MPSRPTVSRRAFLSTAAGCFGGSLLLNAGAFDAVTADASVPTWQQRWGDGTQRKYTAARPDPEALTSAWSVSLDEQRGNVAVECVDADRVYVRDYNRIIAFDRSDGTRSWTYAADEGSFARPTLTEDTVVVSENGTVHAIAAGSGRARWTGSFSAPYRPLVNPTAVDETVYLPTGSAYVTADPTTGFREGAVNASSLGTLLAATDRLLFWWTEGTLHATDYDGNIQWRRTFARSFPPSGKTIAVTDDCIVFHRQSPTGKTLLTALDRQTGDDAWQISRPVGDNVAVTAGPSTVYLGSGTSLYAYDAESGDRKWSLSAETIQPAPVVTPETVYVPLGDGIAPVDPDSGTTQTAPLLDGETPASLAAVDGGLYASSNDRIHALEEA